MIQVPSDEPCLQISDYINRAIQRMHTKNESRYYDYIQEHIHTVTTLYGDESQEEMFSNKTKSPLES